MFFPLYAHLPWRNTDAETVRVFCGSSQLCYFSYTNYTRDPACLQFVQKKQAGPY